MPKVNQLRDCDRRKAQIYRFLRFRLRNHRRSKGDAALWACAAYMHRVLQTENANYSIFNGLLKTRVIHMLIRDNRVYEICFDDSPCYDGEYDSDANI